jgi:ABC-type nitrate/sulfonate/bicarbonate transport system ATPase subunit
VDSSQSIPDPIMHLEHVSFAYDNTVVLRELDLDVGQGEFIVIVGKSGSGKSTLLKIIDHLLPCSGTLRVKGRARMVFQEDRLFPWYRVRQNVALALPDAESDEASDSREKRAERLLAELSMAHLCYRYPFELSGGESQRVAIARAFGAQPQIVLMDEPFGALDVLTREKMQQWLLASWQKNRVAVVFVTHDVDEALMLGDRILVLVDGQLKPVLDVPFSRPRAQDLRYSEDFLSARRLVRDNLHE